MTSILITGCNRGLGLGLVKALNKLPQPPKIFATCRNVEKAEFNGLNIMFNNAGIAPEPTKISSVNEKNFVDAFLVHGIGPAMLSMELRKIAEEHKNVQILEIDLNSFGEYDKLVDTVAEFVNENGLNVLFNNAGVAPKSTRISIVREKDLLDTFTSNTVVPILLTRAFLPLLKKAAEVNGLKPLGFHRAAIFNMSSLLGSIEGNTEGGLYAYRTSKAALNAATKSMSIDLKENNILCAAIHPGWVRTDMGGSKAPLDVETSCAAIVQTILSFNENHNGGFFQYNGEKLPW